MVRSGEWGNAAALWRARAALAALGAAASIWGAAGVAHAERAWVKDEVQINLRTGAGTSYRILGMLRTGDAVEVLSHGDGWTQVKPDSEPEGWIPAGFLQSDPPARVGLSRAQSEARELRSRVEGLEKTSAKLRTENEEIAARDEEQREEITRLTRENLELRAGARWPEWITGAGIVAAGMALGAIIQRSSGRRRAPRIRL